MVYRFERYGNEIKYGAMLTVRESQMAVFVNEGLIADLFEPGFGFRIVFVMVRVIFACKLPVRFFYLAF